MSKIDDLIKQYCPNGVDYKRLIDIANILYGYPFNSKLFTEDDTFIPLIRIRDIKEGKSKTYYKGEVLEDYIIKKGDILVGMDGEFNLGRWKSQDALLNQRTLKISTKNLQVVLDGYLFHILKPLFKNIEKSITGSTVKHLSDKTIKQIKIPVPPLPVQEEIVKVLDAFTALEAELEAELEARKRQYKYYRNKLLTFDENTMGGGKIKFMQLGEICVRQKGISITASTMKELNKEQAPIRIFAGGSTFADVDYGDIPNRGIITKESIIVKSRGNIGFEYYTKPFSHKNEMWSYSLKNNQANLKFIYYYLINNTQKFQLKAKTGKLPQISTPDTDNYIIPVPPIEEQERIVAILDKFDSLVNDISEGLPAELTARRQQYEYYRNKLLTFEEIA